VWLSGNGNCGLRGKIYKGRSERGEMVRAEGFEPPRPFGHQLLRLARLPVPPRPHCLQLMAKACERLPPRWQPHCSAKKPAQSRVSKSGFFSSRHILLRHTSANCFARCDGFSRLTRCERTANAPWELWLDRNYPAGRVRFVVTQDFFQLRRSPQLPSRRSKRTHLWRTQDADS
jgi:hypothetical protein